MDASNDRPRAMPPLPSLSVSDRGASASYHRGEDSNVETNVQMGRPVNGNDNFCQVASSPLRQFSDCQPIGQVPRRPNGNGMRQQQPQSGVEQPWQQANRQMTHDEIMLDL